MILQQRMIRKGGGITMRCAPNQVGTPGVSTLLKIWHQKGQKPCHCSSLEKRQDSSQTMHQKTVPSSVTHPLTQVVSITCGGNPSSWEDVYVLEDAEESGGYFEVRGGWAEKKSPQPCPQHTHRHTHTQTDTHTLYLLFSFFPVELFSTSLSPPSATPAGRNFMYTNEEILNKGIGSRRRH